MSLQSRFAEFNSAIALSDGKLGELREKRRILTDKIRDSKKLPDFKTYNQGSYAMHLGIKPIDDGEYDIDIALCFAADCSEIDPKEIKATIKDILKDHTDYGAEIKRSCVTVTYSSRGEEAFHVDLVSYCYDDSSDTESQMYLAKGKASEEAVWEESDPIKLVEYVNGAIETGDARNQFRRVVRYLKRWKALKFSSKGHAEPPSIGITLSVLYDYEYVPGDDFEALIKSCECLQGRFAPTGDVDEDGFCLYEVTCNLPEELRFPPSSNVFSKMTVRQMTAFKEKLDRLINALHVVREEPDEVQQCKELRVVFGEAFPVPDVASTSRRQVRTYIPSTSSSG